MMRDFLGFLEAMVKRGGPNPSEYESLNACFHELAGNVRNGTTTVEELFRAWRNLGEAFSSVRTLQGHVVAKPYGYDGDFELMDKIYTESVSPDPKLARWDRFFHSQDLVKAVRGREKYCVDLALRLESAIPRTQTLRVLDVGCGPAREVHDLCKTPDAKRIFFDCIDLDSRAIDYAKKLNRDFPEQARFVRRNVLRFKQPEKYDLIWGAGIFDYFSERIFVSVLKRLWSLVAAGGRIVIANLSPSNPTKDYMECGGWFVQYRTRAQLLKLATTAGIPRDRIALEQDTMGMVNYMHVND